MQDQITVEYVKEPSVIVAKTKIPEDLRLLLIEESKSMAMDHRKKSHDPYLVGHFPNGEQLSVKTLDKDVRKDYPAMAELAEIKQQLAVEYIKEYFKIITMSKYGRAEVSVHDMWLNIQKSGDFNPVHNHNCQTFPGLSSFVWLQFPEQIIADRERQLKSFATEPSSSYDHGGWTYLHWGLTNNSHMEQFMMPNQRALIPENGMLYLFPVWLEHVVYPFRGPGERISIATNLNVHYS